MSGKRCANRRILMIESLLDVRWDTGLSASAVELGYFASLGPRLVRNVAVAATALQDETAGWQANGKEMTDPGLTNHIIAQVRAIEAPGTIDPSGPVEQAAAWGRC